MDRKTHPSWQRRHETVLLFFLEYPASSIAACAAATGYSPWQVSRIACSPDFRRHYAEAVKLRTQLVTEIVVDRMTAKKERKSQRVA
jgi:hypothetical protein